MPRKDQPVDTEEVRKEEGKVQEQGVMEVEINPTLLNQKLNYIIAQLDVLIPKKKE